MIDGQLDQVSAVKCGEASHDEQLRFSTLLHFTNLLHSLLTMLSLLLLCLGVAQSTKFVSYIGQAGPGWGNPGSNEDFLKYIGVPGYGGDLGYNVLNFAFWVSDSTNGGAAVNGAAYDWQDILNRITDSSLRITLTGSSSPTAAELRAGIKSLYSADGIDICISAFGGADHPMGNGKNAVTTGQSLATYAKDYDYDCVDVDWEEAYYGYFGATAGTVTIYTLYVHLYMNCPSKYGMNSLHEIT